MNRKSIFLALEFIFIYIGLPLLILYFKNRGLMLGLLWAGTVGIVLWLKFVCKRSFKAEWNWQAAKAGLPHVLKRFALVGGLLVLAMALVHPDRLFSFPLERTHVWLMVMLWYPVLSVIPQEMVYKTLFFERYKPLFPHDKLMVAISALAFGFVHIILLGWVAVVLTTLAGILLAFTYQKTRSLALVSIEHALYGCWAYTIGLGMYLYTGAAWGRALLN